MVSIINKETFFECDSWAHAQENSCGYDNSELLAFYENTNSNSPCSPSTHILEPRLIELFCAIQRAVRNIETASVADVGGANGYLGTHALDFFDLNLKWTVFEQEVFVDLYKKIPYSKIDFATTDQFKTNLTFSISLFSCSLQYIFNCYELLSTAFQNSSFVILSRIPILDQKK
jgi:putative methyltransferase (TIGR04325 family)